MTHPHKTSIITETRHTFQDIYGQEEEASQVPPDYEIRFVDYQGNMASAGKSDTKARRSKKSLLTPKEVLNIGNWNVRTTYAIGKSAQVSKGMREYSIDILGVSECRWTRSGKLRLSTGETVIYSCTVAELQ